MPSSHSGPTRSKIKSKLFVTFGVPTLPRAHPEPVYLYLVRLRAVTVAISKASTEIALSYDSGDHDEGAAVTRRCSTVSCV